MSKIHNLPDAEPRIQVVAGDKLGIKSYGEDNGYPQRMLNLYNACGSAKMCANLAATYFVGRGFEDPTFYHAVINKQGLTPDKLLRRLAPDKAKLRGISMHINYNALYEIDSVSYIPFEHCREGVGDNSGKIGVYKDWYNSKKGGGRRSVEDVIFIHEYNPNPIVIERQVNAAGGWEYYNGQVFWWSADFDTYPLATIDPVLNDVQAEIESANTRKNNLRNNFQLKHIWVEKGQLQDGESEEDVVDGIREFLGSDGKPVSVTFSEDPDGKDIPQLIAVQATMDDKLFQYTDQTARLAIYTSFGQPAILHSDYLGTNGYNEGQLPQSMAYYNSYTDPDRIFFEEVFREIFSKFKEPINPSDNYKPLALEVLNNDIKVEEEDTRALIEIIGVGGTQALQAILADPATNAEQKKNTLVIVFGMSDENASLLAGITT